MITRLGLRPRYPGMSSQRFQELWAEHAQYAKLVSGRLGYVQNFAVLDGGRHLLPYPGFDTCTETVYESKDAMDVAFDTPESKVSLTDHDKFIDSTVTSYLITHRYLRAGGRPPLGSIKLFTVIRRHPTVPPAGLFDAMSGPYSAIIAGIQPIRHEQLLQELNQDFPAPCDAVDIIWFRGASEALRYVHSEVAARAALVLAGKAFGSERLIARPVVHIEPADAL